MLARTLKEMHFLQTRLQEHGHDAVARRATSQQNAHAPAVFDLRMSHPQDGGLTSASVSAQEGREKKSWHKWLPQHASLRTKLQPCSTHTR